MVTIQPVAALTENMETEGKELRETRILIVDDLSSMRKVLRKLLESIGFNRVTEARDAGDAVVKLQSETFDLIISDWQMPTMTGQELLDYVRGDSRFKEIPFVMLTSVADKDSVVAALRSGVSDYLAKPFTADDLEKKLAGLCCRGSGICK